MASDAHEINRTAGHALFHGACQLTKAGKNVLEKKTVRERLPKSWDETSVRS